MIGIYGLHCSLQSLNKVLLGVHGLSVLSLLIISINNLLIVIIYHVCVGVCKLTIRVGPALKQTVV